jgi:hypothetical protein
MPNGKTGLTPSIEVNTIRRVSDQGSRFKLLVGAAFLRVRQAAKGARSWVGLKQQSFESEINL